MKLLVSLAIAAVAIAILLLWGGVSLDDVGAALRTIDAGTLALAFTIQASIYVFRAVRLRGVLRAVGGSEVSLARLTAASAAWILDSHVIPAKVGEASLVLHLARVGVKPEHGLVALLLTRFLDLATLLTVLGATCVVLAASGTREEMPWLGGLGAGLLVAALALILVVARGGHALGFVRRGLVCIGLERTAFGAKVSAFTTRVEESLRLVPRRAIVVAAFWSLPVWATVLGVYAVLGVGVGLTGLTPFDLLFGSSLAILAGIIPITGFLGFGMLDMGWAWGFSAVGVPPEHAIATGLAFHTLYLVGVGLLGALGHARLAAQAVGPDRSAGSS